MRSKSYFLTLISQEFASSTLSHSPYAPPDMTHESEISSPVAARILLWKSKIYSIPSKQTLDLLRGMNFIGYTKEYKKENLLNALL